MFEIQDFASCCLLSFEASLGFFTLSCYTTQQLAVFKAIHFLEMRSCGINEIRDGHGSIWQSNRVSYWRVHHAVVKINTSAKREVLRVSSGLSGCGCSVQCVMFTTGTATTSDSAAGGHFQADHARRSDQCCGRSSHHTSRNPATKIRLRSPLHSWMMTAGRCHARSC